MSLAETLDTPPWESPEWQEAVSQNPGLQPFFDNLESFVELPEGGTKLRKMFIELAVRGKMIPQNENDESASVLRERVNAQRDKLVRAKKIKPPKSHPPLEDNEKFHELPRGWDWLRLGELADWAIGSGFPKRAQGHTGRLFLFAKVSDMNLPGNEKFIETTNNTIDEEIAKDIRVKVHQAGTVVFPKIGGAIATNKRRILIKPTAIDNNCLGLTSFGLCSEEWLYLLLTSIDLTVYQSGTSVPALSQGTLEQIVTALPPLAEQRRIVSKVEGLMSLCDTLEDYRRERESVRERANRSVLASLTTAPRVGDQVSGQETLASAWQRLSDHFEVLLDQPESVPHLRQSILQLAVQGKLVPQDPSHEPATVDSLGNFLRENSLNGYSKKPSDTPEGIQILRISAGTSRSDFYVEETDHKWAVLSDKEREKFNLQPDDLLACRFNGNLHYVGKFSLYRNELGTEQIFPDKLIRFRVDLERLLPRYAVYTLNAEESRQKIESFCATTAGNIGISATNLKTIEMLVPPLAEQKRIVLKVSALLSHCDELASRLRSRQSTTDALLTALIHRILNGTDDE